MLIKILKLIPDFLSLIARWDDWRKENKAREDERNKIEAEQLEGLRQVNRDRNDPAFVQRVRDKFRKR